MIQSHKIPKIPITEDQSAARKLTAEDARRFGREMRAFSREQEMSFDIIGPDDDSSQYGDGDGVFLNVTIGTRDHLTNEDAKLCAEMWRKLVRKHPKGTFAPHLLGFDQDPRELYEFPNVRAYLQLWAKYAGITGPEDITVEIAWGRQFFIGLLAACGCEGFEDVCVVDPDGQSIKPTSSQ
jgi:hypothetical protein